MTFQRIVTYLALGIIAYALFMAIGLAVVEWRIHGAPTTQELLR